MCLIRHFSEVWIYLQYIVYSLAKETPISYGCHTPSIHPLIPLLNLNSTAASPPTSFCCCYVWHWWWLTKNHFPLPMTHRKALKIVRDSSTLIRNLQIRVMLSNWALICLQRSPITCFLFQHSSKTFKHGLGVLENVFF